MQNLRKVTDNEIYTLNDLSMVQIKELTFENQPNGVLAIKISMAVITKT